MIEIFEHPQGFGYKVFSVYQEYDPDFEGFVSMTKERAEQAAQAVYERMTEK